MKKVHTICKPVFYHTLLIAMLIGGCDRVADSIMTVQGSVEAEDIGITLAHEHILVDFIGADSTGYERWNRDSVKAVVLPFLQEAKMSGVRTIFECTPAYLGRDPVLLRMLAEEAELHMITNTGYYGAINNRAIPGSAYTESADQISERWIMEWNGGIENTGIRPGFIKIAMPGDSILSDLHQKLVRAAAKTHLKTGLTINSHTGPAHTAFAELRILMEEGVDPSAFIWTHAQNASQDAHIEAASLGTWISLDNVMENNIDLYVNAILNMKSHGLLNRVLVSHDAGWYDVIDPESITYRGYTAIFTHLKPALINKGFAENEWQQLLIDNPRNAYTIKVRELPAR